MWQKILVIRIEWKYRTQYSGKIFLIYVIEISSLLVVYVYVSAFSLNIAGEFDSSVKSFPVD